MKLLIILFFIPGICLSAGDKSTSPGKIPPSPNKSLQFDINDISENKIRRPLPQTKLSQLIEKIETRLNINRGKFESTEEFESRIKKATNTPIIGSLRPQDTYTFSLPIEDWESFRQSYIAFHYDPDLRVADFYARPMDEMLNGITDQPQRGNAQNVYTLKVEEKEASSKYTGSNSFGSTAVVTKIHNTRHGLAFEYTPFLTSAHVSVDLRTNISRGTVAPVAPVASISMDPSTAKK